MRIVVVGCGDWGKNIARTLNTLGNLYAICDHHHSKQALQSTQELGVPLIDLDHALEDSAVEGVVISTQTLSHYTLAKKALDAGKHVFVEKPLVPSRDEALDLQTRAHKANRVLMVGHLLRYHRAFEQLQEWVNTQKLGRVLHMNTSRKNLGKIYPDEGVIWDLAPHDLSMVLALANNKVESVFAAGANHAIPMHADEATLSLRFKDSDQTAFISLSRLSPLKEQKVSVVGTEGMAVFDDTLGWKNKLTFFENKIIQKTPSQFEILKDTHGTSASLEASEPLKAEMAHFIHSIRLGESPRTPAQEAIDILAIIEAAHQSIKTGSRITL